MDRFFIGLILPEEFSSTVDRWRAKFYPKAVKRHPPHITVHVPFADADPEKLTRSILEMLSQFEPIEIKVVGYGVFPNEKNVLHLKVEGNPELSQLNRSLLSLTGTSAKWQFNPHITIAKLAEGELRSAVKLLGNEDLNWQFVASDVVLFRENPDLSWEVWRKFKIGFQESA